MTAYEWRISDLSSYLCSSDLFCRRAPVRLCVVPSLCDLCRISRASADPVRGPDRRRVRVGRADRGLGAGRPHLRRSEEHTSELQSLMRISYAVFSLKKTNTSSLRA